MHIAVSSLNNRHKIDEKFVEAVARNILKILKKDGPDIEITFLSDRAIKPINKKYKGANRATDVLSFDLGLCGQVIISSDMALRNSRTFKTSFEEELVLYVIHGILHLFGYDDENRIDKLKMFKKQSSIMETLCAKIDLSKVLMRP